MTYATLGTLPLESIQLPSTVTVDAEASYVEQPVIGGPGRLQRSGRRLSRLRWPVRLRRVFPDGTRRNPYDDLEVIREAFASGEQLLVTIASDVLGYFVIERISERHRSTTDIDVDLDLIEYQ